MEFDPQKYYENNPRLYEMFEEETNKLLKLNIYVNSTKVLEKVRERIKEKKKGEHFKINNNCKPFFSRIYNEKHGEVFKIRSSKIDEVFVG